MSGPFPAGPADRDGAADGRDPLHAPPQGIRFGIGHGADMSVDQGAAAQKAGLQCGEEVMVLVPVPGRQLREDVGLRVRDGGARELARWGGRLLTAVAPAGHHLAPGIDQHGSEQADCLP
ncbi:hypothetical protein GCM10010129_40640 [Streptomyces fumigatiscleroticus]|nr:hypothetical protein GCM10010129_40640 [Streptomyces fumigatiscleroticus]